MGRFKRRIESRINQTLGQADETISFGHAILEEVEDGVTLVLVNKTDDPPFIAIVKWLLGLVPECPFDVRLLLKEEESDEGS